MLRSIASFGRVAEAAAALATGITAHLSSESEGAARSIVDAPARALSPVRSARRAE